MVEEFRNKVIIVGCGPGVKAYISPKAVYNIKKAEILIGSRRLLRLFPGVDAKKIVLEKNYKQLTDRIAEWYPTKQIVILVSGDPGFYSYTKLIIKKIGRKSCSIIPGISSMQLAFASIGEGWEDACFVSLHGRNSAYAQLIKKVKNYTKVGILTDRENSASVIARRLMERGIKDKKMFVCENLSLPDEHIHEVDLKSAVNLKTNGTAVVIIVDKKK